MAYSGKFVPKNRQKYKGDWSKITYRSNWEKFFMGYLDNHPMVTQWSSEEVIIPYFSNADGKKRRYFMDFMVTYNTGQTFLIEVKPKKETSQPKPPPKLTASAKKKYMNEIYTYQVNQDKWEAASLLCNKKGWNFRVLTEDGLRNLGMKI